MDADTARRNVLDARHGFLEAHPRQGSSQLLLRLPLAYADAIWTEHRATLDPDKRARAEWQDGRPCQGGTFMGMVVDVDDTVSEPEVSALWSIDLTTSR